MKWYGGDGGADHRFAGYETQVTSDIVAWIKTTKAAAKRNVTQAIERTAARLGNTPAICRKSYVHPEVVDAYLDGSLVESLKAEVEAELREELTGLRPEEVPVLAFLQRRLAREVEEAKAAA